MSARRLAARGALVGLAALAAGFVRTTSETTDEPLFWPVPVVAYHVNPVVDPAHPAAAPSCDPDGSAAPAIEAVRAGFAAWEQGCDDLRLVYGGTLPELRTGLMGTAENLVVLRRGWCSQHPLARADPCMTDPDVDCGGIYGCFEDTGRFADHAVVASTSVLYDPRSGRIYGADVELVGWDGAAGALTGQAHGYYFTCDTEAPPATRPTCTTYGERDCNGYDLQNTVTHEAGHFVGLAHPCGDFGQPSCSSQLPPTETVPYDERTMYRLTAIGETSKRALSADDVNGVCAIYPPAAGGCGCAAGGEAGALGTLLAVLAALALRPRLR